MNKHKLIILLACLALLLAGCGAQESVPERVPPAAEVNLKRDGELHTLTVKDMDSTYQLMLIGDNLYISESETIEQIPLAEPGKRQVVLTLEEGHVGHFFTVGQECYLDSTDGGMETSARYRLLSQGQWERLPEAGAVYAQDQLVMVEEEPYEETGNLYVLKGDEKKSIGDKRYHYEQLGGSEGIALLEDGIILGGHVPGEEAYNLLLKVTLPDGETTVVTEYADELVVDQNDLYIKRFVAEDNASPQKAVLDKIPAASGEAQRISLPNPYAANYGQFTALEGLFYYQDNAYTARPLIAGGPPEYIEEVLVLHRART